MAPGVRTPECMLNPLHMLAARFAQRHAMARTCRNELAKRLFEGDGLIATRDGRRLQPNAAFASYLKRDLKPCTMDAFETINLIGILPIAFKRDRYSPIGEDQLVPYIPEFGSYTITVSTVDGQPRYRFYWGSSSWLNADQASLRTDSLEQWNCQSTVFGRRDKTIVVMHSFGSSPTIDGSLVSVYALIAEQLGFVEELRQRMLVAERISSNPPVVSEYQQINNGSDEQLKTGYYGVDSTACEQQAEYTYQRNAGQLESLRRQMQVYQQTMGIDSHALLGVRKTKDVHPNYNLDTGSTPWGGEVYLGAERHLVRQVLPSTRSDFVPIVEQTARIVCGLMGVPHTLFSPSGGRDRAGVDAGSEALARTINEWVSKLSDVATLIYQSTMGTIDLYRELRSRAEHRRRLNPAAAVLPARLLINEDDLLDARQKTSIRISFDINPTTNQDGLVALRAYGVIDEQSFGELMLRVNNLPRDLLVKRAKPVEQDEQRLLTLNSVGGKVMPSAKKPTDCVAKKQSGETACDPDESAEPSNKRQRVASRREK